MPGPSATLDQGAPIRRSNRPVTQFAVRATQEFLLGKAEVGRQTVHNTTVDIVQEDKHSITLFVRLFSETILTLTMSLPDEQVVHICLSVGTAFTMGGCPTKTTIERLNGLLDCMGTHGVIPEKVRIFKDPGGSGSFFFGKNDYMIPVGEHYARNITLVSDPDELLIQSSDASHDWPIMKKKVVGSSVVYEKRNRLVSNG